MKISAMPCQRRHAHARGFTLIEVMITVVIISILAAVALPQYKNYVIRGKIPDATSMLAAKQVRLEQFYQDNRTYVGATDCNSDSTTSSYFTFSCSASSASAYTLQAVGKDTMAGFTYTVNQSGTKTSTIASPAGSGWIASSANCWITKTGGTC